jgi:hypothetical protein
VKSYKKIATRELPIIGLNDGPNFLHIRDALIQYCERELGLISGIFIDGKYRDPATVSYDLAIIEADKTGIAKDQVCAKLKRTDADSDRYEKVRLLNVCIDALEFRRDSLPRDSSFIRFDDRKVIWDRSRVSIS